jgi:hypothetical protein
MKRDRVWFFAGYQCLRDYESQPGADPRFPRSYEQNKIFVKSNWQLKPGLQLLHSLHDGESSGSDVRDPIRCYSAPACARADDDVRPVDADIVG